MERKRSTCGWLAAWPVCVALIVLVLCGCGQRRAPLELRFTIYDLRLGERRFVPRLPASCINEWTPGAWLLAGEEGGAPAHVRRLRAVFSAENRVSA